MNCKCGAELLPVDSPPPEFMCPECDTMYGTMNGEFREVPKSGKLSDWPEMQRHMDGLIKEALGDCPHPRP